MATAIPGIKRPVGRPRSQSSRLAILETAFQHLRTKPFASISPLHIANEAGVSSATVYRWWPTKEALLLDAALDKLDPQLILKTEGEPLERLRDYVLKVSRIFIGEYGIVIARIITAIQDNPTLRREFLRRIWAPRDKEARALVEEAINEGTLPPGMDIGAFLDAIYGPLVSRLLVRHESMDEAFVHTIFDVVVSGTQALGRQGRSFGLVASAEQIPA